MSNRIYSTYEAKARFSELLRQVSKNRELVITSRGRPVARLVPYEERAETLDARLLRLEQQGVVDGASSAGEWFLPILEKSGVVARFIEERS